MVNLFERNRRKIILAVVDRLRDADEDRAIMLIRRVCKHFDVPATESMIQDAAAEAIRRKIDEKLDQAKTAFINLKNKVDSYHP